MLLFPFVSGGLPNLSGLAAGICYYRRNRQYDCADYTAETFENETLWGSSRELLEVDPIPCLLIAD